LQGDFPPGQALLQLGEAFSWTNKAPATLGIQRNRNRQRWIETQIIHQSIDDESERALFGRNKYLGACNGRCYAKAFLSAISAREKS